MTGGSDRRYVCTSCETIVRARWSESTSFFIGCDCTSVPVVPQMTQNETPDNWRVERPECCRGVEVRDLESEYGHDFADYRCPDCGSLYGWAGTMIEGPDDPPDKVDENQRQLIPDGGSSLTVSDRPDPEDNPFVCSLCGVALGTTKRIAGGDYCDSCQREHGMKPPIRQCMGCGRDYPEEQMEAIDVSLPDQYYPEFRYLCRGCSSEGGDDLR